MTLDIQFSAAAMPSKGTLVMAVPEASNKAELVLPTRAARLDKALNGQISRAMKIKKFDGKAGAHLTLLAPADSTLDAIVLLGMGTAQDLTTPLAENWGGAAWGLVSHNDSPVTFLLEKPVGTPLTHHQWVARVAFGAYLRAYKFDRYKTKTKKPAGGSKLAIASAANAASLRRDFGELKAIADGMVLARDLVNEPSNILTPTAFANRAKKLTKLGVKVEVLGEAQLETLGMGALLGVGQGSVQETKLVVMQYNGAAKSLAPVAFIGKGVCFDTGGISIKPAGGMEDMKGDMGGAAAVTGLMHALAARKAKVNVVGVIGLVENMPDGNAQRPGDIVTSMSGQTIEVLNTDAEGRLVLADALWYTQKRFQPRFMIDLATLTGAILVALGQEYAGLFSNDDKLSEQLAHIGDSEGEKVWRMPLCAAFDKMIDTPNADMKNIGGRYAGSSTAGQFLQRFTNDVAWVHLDIAGTAMSSPKSAINHSWGSGYGVRLLDRLVKAHYERKR